MAVGLIIKTVSRDLKIELVELQVTDNSTSSPNFRDPTAADLWQHLKSKFEQGSLH